MLLQSSQSSYGQTVRGGGFTCWVSKKNVLDIFEYLRKSRLCACILHCSQNLEVYVVSGRTRNPQPELNVRLLSE